MTEIEWEKEARQIAIAFNLPLNTPAEVSVCLDETFLNDNTFGVKFRTSEFIAFGGFIEPENLWALEVTNNRNRSITCYGLPNTPTINWCSSRYPEHIHLLARAMINLGFDSLPLEAEFGLTISAHEKLEWQLEFARRMREDARENGE